MPPANPELGDEKLPVVASELPVARRMASLRAAFGASLAAAGTRLQSVGLALPSPALWSAWAAAMEPTPRWLAALRFDNRALRALPVETPPPGPEDVLSTPRPVPGACFSRARPAPLRRPRLVALSGPALSLLGLEASEEAEVEAEAALFFSGNALLPGAEPAAHCYCGHQFGQFAGQLGDGAAMYLGEVCTAAGERWELQLKGAGPTPFSRCGTRGAPRRPPSARLGETRRCSVVLLARRQKSSMEGLVHRRWSVFAKGFVEEGIEA